MNDTVDVLLLGTGVVAACPDKAAGIPRAEKFTLQWRAWLPKEMAMIKITPLGCRIYKEVGIGLR